MTNGEKVIAAARTKLGCEETPPGSNNGPCVRDIQSSTGAYGQAWCGSFVKWSYDKAGVDDGGIASASTWMIVHNAQAAGRIRNTPMPGCILVWRPGPTGHTEIYIKTVGRNLAITIGGNTGDAVREHVRYIGDATIVVPKSLEEEPPPVYRTLFWWEDPAAAPDRHGLYATIVSREKAARLWAEKHGSPGHIRRGKLSVMHDGRLVPRYTFWTGPRKRSPDFTSKTRRDLNMAKVAAQTGHTLRPRSRRERIS